MAAKKIDTQFGSIVVYAAASVEPASDSIHSLIVLLAVVGPTLVLFVGGMTWWFVGRTLRPVEEIRRQVADISATDLDKRVPEPETADEVQRLAATMNAMLGRVEDAVKHQRAFISDAAHELRSPSPRSAPNSTLPRHTATLPTGLRSSIDSAAVRAEWNGWSKTSC